MFEKKLLVGAVLALAYAQAADAQPGPTLDGLLQKIQELERRDAEKQRQIEALQQRLQTPQAPATPPAAAAASQAEAAPPPTAQVAQPPVTEPQSLDPVQSPGLTPYPVPGLGNDTVTAGTAFNPAISMILDGVYYHDDRGGTIPETGGFHVPTADGHDHGGELDRGFNLRETEIVLAAAVDPFLNATAILSVSKEGVEVEEAYGSTRRLPAGLQLKFGKFYSDIGYINKQHPHQWDFVDQALPYQALFGGSLNETGVQLSWLPDLPFYTRLGVEVLQGQNSGAAHYLGPDADSAFSRKAGPRLVTAFAKFSPDLGYNHALQAGLFGGRGFKHQELDEGAALDGDTWFAGTDWVYKYDSPRPFGQGDLTLQGEYLYRVKDLTVRSDPADPTLLGQGRRFSQDGFYVQGVYGFAPRWTSALRFDTVGLTNRLQAGTETSSLDDSRRWSANLTWNPTEFSRFRLQYARGDYAVSGARERFNQVFLQYQLSLGVHGAHKF